MFCTSLIGILILDTTLVLRPTAPTTYVADLMLSTKISVHLVRIHRCQLQDTALCIATRHRIWLSRRSPQWTSSSTSLAWHLPYSLVISSATTIVSICPMCFVSSLRLNAHAGDQLSLEYTIYEEKVTYDTFKAHMGSSPVYVTLGNHDSFPVRTFCAST